MSEELQRIKGVGPLISQKLSNAGIKTIEEIASSRPEDLAWIRGLGIENSKKIIKSAQEILKLEDNLKNVLDSIKQSFMKACPKCGGEMQRKMIILGPENRVSVNQCKVCKFYLPR
ncbi:MAG: DNA repair and recombination protein RadA [Promethearchaeota archaeon]|nr:MAG: DNA repair and recombination protein RadA [Candidatus Lokiarchaeota archaeon]